MSLLALISTAGALGLLGGMHCIAMCAGAQRVAVHGLGRGDTGGGGATQPLRFLPLAAGAGTPAPWRGGLPVGLAAALAFHASRLLGYALLGALIGGGSSVLRWGAEAAPVFRPLWGGVNAGLLALGLALLIAGRQPGWIDALGQRLWSLVGARLQEAGLRRPLTVGAAWALLPCGLLYSALAVAMLASDPLRGMLTMLAFGVGTAVNLLAAQTLLRALLSRLGTRARRVEAIGIRIGGALLAAMAAAALVALALGQPHPFC
jgi:uncharacterized protein